MENDAASTNSSGEMFHLELTAAELKIAHTAITTFMHDFGHEERDVGRLAREVLAKFPPEETIRAIDISEELKRH